jgi:hypothetical protein
MLTEKNNASERWKKHGHDCWGSQGETTCCRIMHIIVYVGFVIINIELLEIIIDGLLYS